MPPSIDLSLVTFGRLQTHAVPLVDTIETVINRMIDSYEQHGPGSPEGGSQAVREFNPNTPPDLTHAKILGASFCGRQLGRGQDNWNGLLNAAVVEAFKKAESEAALSDLLSVRFVRGNKQDEGFRPVAGTNLSVQGQDANGAWRAVCHIAQGLRCQVSVKFAWREKEGAAYPGITGQLRIPGS